MSYSLQVHAIGSVAVRPQLVSMITTDDFGTITAEGYLNAQKESAQLYHGDLVIVNYDEHSSEKGLFNVTISDHKISLIPAPSGNGGDVQAGFNGHEGEFISYPPGVDSGTLRLKAANNSDNFAVTISNGSFGQDCTMRFTDPGVADGSFLTSRFLEADVNSNMIDFRVYVTAALLAMGPVVLFLKTDTAKSYRLWNLRHGVDGDGDNLSFSGGGGDRDLLITQSTTPVPYTVMPAAKIGALINAEWGSADIPYPAGTISVDTPLTGSNNLIIQYFSGTTDYAVGAVYISGTLQRIE